MNEDCCRWNIEHVINNVSYDTHPTSSELSDMVIDNGKIIQIIIFLGMYEYIIHIPSQIVYSKIYLFLK